MAKHPRLLLPKWQNAQVLLPKWQKWSNSLPKWQKTVDFGMDKEEK